MYEIYKKHQGSETQRRKMLQHKTYKYLSQCFHNNKDVPTFNAMLFSVYRSGLRTDERENNRSYTGKC